MLDLKQKLLQAGLVTEEEVKRVEREAEEAKAKKADPRKKRKGKKGRGPGAFANEDARWQKRIEELKAAGKSEQYEAIRSWVQKTRLDPVGSIPSEAAERFYFERHDGSIAHLILEPDVREKVKAGEAAIIAFMSNNGLAHAVVPRDVALDVKEIRPEWLRVLETQGAGARDEGAAEP